MRKVYELKKGTEILKDGEILEFLELRGDKAVFINTYYEEIEFPDYLDIEEIGEIYKEGYYEDTSTASLF
ncbi:MAG: succinyl-diaminopimelate desuccinylase [Epsilonproteobacteria bacterium]|nr:succinyl-diaminopimelate desuccinylase [Campylobacterota bacterium]